MAVLRIRLTRPAGEELERLWNGGSPPRWVARTLETRGARPGEALPSAMVEALGEQLGRRLEALALLLRRAEARSWAVELRDGEVEIASGLAADATRRALEADGVWLVVERLTAAGDARLVT